MNFEDFKSDVVAARSALQDITSVAYMIVPIADDFNFVAYFDTDTLQMVSSITDQNLTELKILDQIPSDILIEYGNFLSGLRDWEDGIITDIPFTAHAGLNAGADFVEPEKVEDAKENAGKLI